MSDPKFPNWCCQSCGREIGYIGRFFQWLLGCDGARCFRRSIDQ